MVQLAVKEDTKQTPTVEKLLEKYGNTPLIKYP